MQDYGHIHAIPVEQEMKDSYLNYAMSVIVSRALPDIQDGLKPSQRRILVAMNDLGLTPGSKFRKCAKIAGDTSGNYHPHGEQVIYPTLVRMAQDFVMLYPLIEGQGNFGSIDGDPPAAMRYTEARLSPFAMMMLDELNLRTVDFVPNYDGTLSEPRVLPSKFPNIICNGSSGIAVGMATSIPPHNLGEVCDALIALIERPQISVQELLKYIRGPDFPTGGIICGTRDLHHAYQTGRGVITVRAKLRIEDGKAGHKDIVITEIPYNQSKTKIIEQIAELVKQERIQGISTIRDESDRDGLRIVIELKRGEDENVIINQLYNDTSLQDTFSIIMIALSGMRPQIFNIKGLLEAYRDHRVDVIRRRTEFLLGRAQHEAHILEGLSTAIEAIDEVIQIIRGSANPEIAEKTLMERFKLTQPQADAILKMPLQRLTSLESEKVYKDLDRLHERILEYQSILADQNLILDIIREDLYEMKERYATPRRTLISETELEAFEKEQLIPEEEMVVVLTHKGYIKRVPLTSYHKQKRGGKGVLGAEIKEEDLIDQIFLAGTHDYILFFTNRGKVHWEKVYELPLLSRTSKGKPLISILELKPDEVITKAIPVRDFSEGYLIMATRSGTVKKTELRAYGNPQRGGIIAIKLTPEDKLIGVDVTRGKSDLLLGTADGMAIRFPEGDLRPAGRATFGVTGIRLTPNDYVVDMVIVDPQADLLTVCENGYGKRTSFERYRKQSRGGKGVINIRTAARNGKVIGMKSVKDQDDVILITQKGLVIRLPVREIRVSGRSTQGVRLIRLEKDDKLVALAKVMHEGEDAKET
jgi:DNA gyrase subunit A